MKLRTSKIVILCILILSVSTGFSQTYGQYGRRFLQLEETEKTSEQKAMERELDKTRKDLERPFALEEAIDPATYILGPGDQFTVSILTEMPLNYTLFVSPTGDLLIPSVGVVDLEQETLENGLQKIEAFIRSNYKNAKISVALSNIREFQVQLAGAVNLPGFYTVTPLTRLHEIVEMAEGFHQFAREYDIQVSRDGRVKTVDHLKYVQTGDLSGNPTFLEGDQIFVPFGNVEEEGVVIRGSIEGSGYDIIKREETLSDFLKRRARFDENANLESVTITRMENGAENFITVYPEDFKNTILIAGDQIDILRERGVAVNGYVREPGGYKFFPGYTLADYVGLAGGNTAEGDIDRALVRHLDGAVEKGRDIAIRRGDVIIVPRTYKSILFGESSILRIVSSIASLILTYIAATK